MFECVQMVERGQCDAKVFGDGVLCYYHQKVADGLIEGGYYDDEQPVGD